MSTNYMEIEGIDELLELFKSLATAYDKKIFKQKLLKTSEKLAHSLSVVAPMASKGHWKKSQDSSVGSEDAWKEWVEPGSLKKSMVAKIPKRQRRGRTIAYVKRQYKIAPHAHLIEYGHVMTRKKGGKKIKWVQPKPFFWRTVSRQEDMIINGIATAALEILEDRVNKIIKKEAR